MIKLNSPESQNQIWTMISAGVSSTFPFFLMLLTTRFIGLTFAGILAYAIAIYDMLRILTLFGVREYQGSDISQKFSFHAYLGLRTLTALIATIVLVVILLVGRFDELRFTVILTLFFIGMTDVYADVFMGDLQQKGKMRIAGRMRASGFASALAVFAITIIITQVLTISLALAGLAILFMNIAWIWVYRHRFGAIRVKFDISAIKKLLLIALPLVATIFLTAYLQLAQKYYLAAFVSDDAVAIYTILMLPTSLLLLFSTSFFMGAELTRAAVIFQTCQLRQYVSRINKYLLLIAAIAVPYLAITYFLGIPILSWLYDTDLSQYFRQLMLLAFGGIFLVVTVVLGSSLIVMRRQRMRLFCTIIATPILAPLMLWLVWQYGLNGAAFANIVIFVPLSTLLYIAWRKALKDADKKQSPCSDE